MKGMQIRPLVCVIKGMYEFAFSVCIIKAHVTGQGAGDCARMLLHAFVCRRVHELAQLCLCVCEQLCVFVGIDVCTCTCECALLGRHICGCVFVGTFVSECIWCAWRK